MPRHARWRSSDHVGKSEGSQSGGGWFGLPLRAGAAAGVAAGVVAGAAAAAAEVVVVAAEEEEDEAATGARGRGVVRVAGVGVAGDAVGAVEADAVAEASAEATDAVVSSLMVTDVAAAGARDGTAASASAVVSVRDAASMSSVSPSGGETKESKAHAVSGQAGARWG